MRRLGTVAMASVMALSAATPASAAESSAAVGGWTPAPQASYDLPAGARCDFAVHTQPVVDEVRKLVLDTYPDGKPKRELYAGDLILEITNTGTGASTRADAGGTTMIDYHTDGSMTWYAVGPVMAGFRTGGGTLPRGLYIIDGVYTLDVAADGYKTVGMVHGSTRDLCADVA